MKYFIYARTKLLGLNVAVEYYILCEIIPPNPSLSSQMRGGGEEKVRKTEPKKSEQSEEKRGLDPSMKERFFGVLSSENRFPIVKFDVMSDTRVLKCVLELMLRRCLLIDP